MNAKQIKKDKICAYSGGGGGGDSFVCLFLSFQSRRSENTGFCKLIIIYTSI